MVGRRRIDAGFGAPPFIVTNARAGFLSIDGIRLYFFPDRLLVLGRGGARTVPYADLSFKAGTIRFVEEGGVSRDAKVVGTTCATSTRTAAPTAGSGIITRSRSCCTARWRSPRRPACG